MKPFSSLRPPSTAAQQTFCFFCRFARLQTRFLSSGPVSPKGEPKLDPPGPRGRSSGPVVPQQLSRPLGLSYPPEIGDNAGNDRRTLRQRIEDLADQEKQTERRAQLAKEFSKPYFREWSRMRYHHGKTFISNPRLFKRDKSLYFPNLFGRTLDPLNPLQDTTPVLRGKISVVKIFSSLWAERQANSFTGSEQNPALHQIIQESEPFAQRVDINAEDNWLKALLVRSFMSSLRRKLPTSQHGRYFLVTKGFTDQIKEDIGILNSKVGYVYLLDEDCRIRWVGNSLALPTEIESLNAGLRRLVQDRRKNTAVKSESIESMAEHISVSEGSLNAKEQ